MSISQAVYEAQIQRITDLQARLAEAERLLRLHYNDQAPANWGEQVRVFLAGVADSANEAREG